METNVPTIQRAIKSRVGSRSYYLLIIDGGWGGGESVNEGVKTSEIEIDTWEETFNNQQGWKAFWNTGVAGETKRETVLRRCDENAWATIFNITNISSGKYGIPNR